MPAALDRYYTREEVLAFPEDGHRYELVHAELLVSPAPLWLHQTVVVNLSAILREYVRRQRLGQVLTSPADISWGGLPDLLVQPDVFVVDRRHSGEAHWDAITSLSLVVEVLSPSTARYDRFTKRRLYQERKVPLYWIIDPDNRFAEVWTPDVTAPVVERERLRWRPGGAVGPLEVELEELFEP